MSLTDRYKVVKMANDSHDRLLTPTEAEIEWDYSKPRLRANVRRKANGKQKSPRDRRALANKLKRGCDENALDRLCSPLNLRSRSYKQRKSRECESDGRSRRAKKTAQTRERLRSLVLQFEAFEADGNDQHVSVGGEDLEALCAGIENETWESDEGDVGQRVSRDDDSSRRHDPVVELTASIRSEEEGKRSVDSEGCNLVQPNDIRSAATKVTQTCSQEEIQRKKRLAKQKLMKKKFLLRYQRPQ
ncbi:uncharacterized protein LOC134188180 [Corticium candelabrum]|uniref:uncharacterized protein LOC134188180 n=1 Tax=Corticium candelabrum TaxID=121492 RepID=UPI002E256781|nr:uncharacterized protein LOC134188180 [Corticium candelabrum]